MPLRRTFSLRALFCLVTVCALGSGWLGILLHRAERQRIAVIELEKAGGKITYEVNYHIGGLESRLRNIFGHDLFDKVIAAELANVGNPKAPLELLPSFSTSLQRLQLFGMITNSDLKHAECLANLESLSLILTQVDDDGLVVLRKLSKLRQLQIKATNCTDDALVHLSGLVQLESLDLHGTKITGTGFRHLQSCSELKSVCLLSCPATNAGLKELANFPNLQEIELSGDAITDEGLLHLHRLNSPRRIRLLWTSVSEAGVANLALKFPTCEIDY